jgi:hypothetical protein
MPFMHPLAVNRKREEKISEKELQVCVKVWRERKKKRKYLAFQEEHIAPPPPLTSQIPQVSRRGWGLLEKGKSLKSLPMPLEHKTLYRLLGLNVRTPPHTHTHRKQRLNTLCMQK